MDVILNAAALLCLNDLDNVATKLFTMQLVEEEEENNEFAENMNKQDRLFAKVISMPNFIIALVYGLQFLGAYEYAHPLDGIEQISLFQPYSVLGFPIIVLPTYLLFFHYCCLGVRKNCSCFDSQESNKNEESGTEVKEIELNDTKNEPQTPIDTERGLADAK